MKNRGGDTGPNPYELPVLNNKHIYGKCTKEEEGVNMSPNNGLPCTCTMKNKIEVEETETLQIFCEHVYRKTGSAGKEGDEV